MSLFYGLVAGFSEMTPVSASAHRVLFPMLFDYPSSHPLIQFFVHGGALGALMVLYWGRISHIFQEMRLLRLPPKRRRRPPDTKAIVDGKIVQTSILPVIAGAAFWTFGGDLGIGLGVLAVLLAIGSLAVLADFAPSMDNTNCEMSRIDSFLLGLCSAVGSIPGFSRIGMMIGISVAKKWNRPYFLEIVMLMTVPMLAILMVFDLLALVLAGFGGLSLSFLLGCLAAALASFLGALGGIFMVRFLAMKTGFSAFAYYSWALGMFSFILYLMV